MAEIRVTPQFAVIDDEVEITVSGLEPNCAVTIDASIVYYKVLHIGYGHFFADSVGKLSLNTCPSHGGTYSGLQPMGLFSSMRAMPSKHAYPRLLVKGSTEIVLKFKLNVWKGHLTQDQVHQLHVKDVMPGMIRIAEEHISKHILCRNEVKRSYLSPTVRRIPVKTDVDGDTVCGVLFLPKGGGPFPGVIDLFGGAGGCVEIRAALLAKHGFASLALAYFGYDGLKAKSAREFQMSYFDRAIKWLSQHPQVKPGGISMVGVCVGAQITLLCAIRNPSVRCAICINSSYLMRTDNIEENPFHFTDVSNTSQHFAQIWRGMLALDYDNPPKLPRPPLKYDHDNPILFLVGEYDRNKPVIDDVIDQLQKSGKKRWYKKFIHGQGHLIEPPYMPLCVASPSPVGLSNEADDDFLHDELAYDWNGDFKTHGPSQIEAWKIQLEFLHKYGDSSQRSKI